MWTPRKGIELAVGLLNCHKSFDALEEGILCMGVAPFVLILNEPAFKPHILLDPNFEVFAGIHSANLAIITNIKGWKLTWVS